MRYQSPLPHPRPHGHHNGGSDGRAGCQTAATSPSMVPAAPAIHAIGLKSAQTAVLAETAIIHRQTGTTAKNGRFGPVLRFICRPRPPQCAQTFHLWPLFTLLGVVAFKQTVDITQRPAARPKRLTKTLAKPCAKTLATIWPRTLAKTLGKPIATTWPQTWGQTWSQTWAKSLAKALAGTWFQTLATTWPQTLTQTLAKALARTWPQTLAKAPATIWFLTPTKPTSIPRPAVNAALPAIPQPGHV
jgi:hypothetical protein